MAGWVTVNRWRYRKYTGTRAVETPALWVDMTGSHA